MEDVDVALTWYAFYCKELPWALVAWRALSGVPAVATYFRWALVAVAGVYRAVLCRGPFPEDWLQHRRAGL